MQRLLAVICVLQFASLNYGQDTWTIKVDLPKDPVTESDRSAVKAKRDSNLKMLQESMDEHLEEFPIYKNDENHQFEAFDSDTSFYIVSPNRTNVINGYYASGHMTVIRGSRTSIRITNGEAVTLRYREDKCGGSTVKLSDGFRSLEINENDPYAFVRWNMIENAEEVKAFIEKAKKLPELVKEKPGKRVRNALPSSVLKNLETEFFVIHILMTEKDVLRTLGLSKYPDFLLNNYSFSMGGGGFDHKVYVLSTDGHQLEFRDFMGNDPECLLYLPNQANPKIFEIGQRVSDMEGFNEFLNPEESSKNWMK